MSRQQARRKKQEEKAQRKKAKEEKAKAEQEAKEKGEAVTEEGKKDEKEEDHSADQGIKEPEKEPIKIKRNAEPDPDPDPAPDAEPALMKETSGLAHLRRRRVKSHCMNIRALDALHTLPFSHILGFCCPIPMIPAAFYIPLSIYLQHNSSTSIRRRNSESFCTVTATQSWKLLFA